VFGSKRGTSRLLFGFALGLPHRNRRRRMNGLIYLIGLIVVILAILSFFGLR
jgi:hypothetical protein